jgi:hypothetical protein
MNNVEMRTKLVEILRHVLTTHGDLDLSKEDEREAVIDELALQVGVWAREVVEEALRRWESGKPFDV